jgi:SAM-dependent methyltransferase
MDRLVIEEVALKHRSQSSHSNPDCADLYSIEGVPIFQNMLFDTCEEARNCITGDVHLVRHAESGIVVNRSFRAELMQYDAKYQNEQAVSAVFREHLDQVCAVVEKHFTGRSLIEVGCGKGHFLELLQRKGFRATGVDPAYEGTNPAVIKDYFSPNLALRAQGIVLRHVLEHVEDPIGFLSKICDANGGAGRIYIEVPSFEWICQRRAWFDIFYEHVNYFSPADFRRIFGTIEEIGHVFGGQYFYVVAELASLRRAVPTPTDWLDFPSDFLAGVQKHVIYLKSQGSVPTAIWGGASKGVTFALFMKRAGAQIDMVIDKNPAKHGKYLPGTGHRVHAPDEAMALLPRRANIVVVNSNYLEEIRDATQDAFHYIPVDRDFI